MKRLSLILAILVAALGLVTVASPANAQETNPETSNVWASWYVNTYDGETASSSWHYAPNPDGSYGSALCAPRECSKVVLRTNPTTGTKKVVLRQHKSETFVYGSYYYTNRRHSIGLSGDWDGSALPMSTTVSTPKGKTVRVRLAGAYASTYNPAFEVPNYAFRGPK